MKPIANGSIFEVGDIPVVDGAGGSHVYKCAAVIVFDSLDDLQKAIRHGAIEARYRVGAQVSPGAASQDGFDSQVAVDRAHPPSPAGGESHLGCASLPLADLPPADPSTRDAASQSQIDSHQPVDRRALAPSKPPTTSQTTRDSRGYRDRRRAAPSTSIDKSAARAVSRSGVFDMHLGADVVFGDLTYRTWLQVAPKFAAATEFAKQMHALKWKSLDRPLREWLSESEARELIESVMRAREAAAIAARSLTHGR